MIENDYEIESRVEDPREVVENFAIHIEANSFTGQELRDVLFALFTEGYMIGIKHILTENVNRDQDTLNFINGEAK